ncbi:anti-sigma factor [Novosphingobium sp. B1]|uniref:anti-sigma factor family protein n=1 Tax=Novosphingobium sp. B1 TaxID=1938756 RepID=UPI0009D8264F|nr:hypothetical protein [Novosphingobium sp. B1]SMD08483.1 hypothetical protein SAMN06272759_1384 [Novosphingobium sp. B1]
MTLSREERLAAWLDGELTGDDLTAFQAELAADPELAALAEEWKANDSLIAGAFAPVAEAPIDQAMLERLGLAERLAPLPANDNSPWWKRHALPLGGAIAASLVAILVVAPRSSGDARDPLSRALDETPSLAQADLPDGRKITPMLTAQAADGRWCREFGDGSSIALACRADKGSWIIEAKGKGAAPVDNAEFAVASGADDSALNAAQAHLKLADPVSAEAEQALIAKKWGGHSSK